MSSEIADVVITLLSRAMKESEKNRHEIAAEVSVTTGHTISKAMIDTWTARSKGAWRFPLEFAPAFELATKSTYLSEFLAHCSNGQVIFGDDIELLEIAKVEKQILALENKKLELLKLLSDRS